MNKKKTLVFLTSLLFLAINIYCPMSTHGTISTPYLLWGTVSHPDMGEISGAVVEARDGSGNHIGNATTDASGAYTMSLATASLEEGERIYVHAVFEQMAGTRVVTYETGMPGKWCNITITSFPKLLLLGELAQDTASPGESTTLAMSIGNTGGANVNSVSVIIDTVLSVAISPEPSFSTIEPGDFMALEIGLTVPEDAEAGIAYNISVKATGADNTGEEVEPAWANFTLVIEHSEESKDMEEAMSKIMFLLLLAFIVAALFVVIALMDKRRKSGVEDREEEYADIIQELEEREGDNI